MNQKTVTATALFSPVELAASKTTRRASLSPESFSPQMAGVSWPATLLTASCRLMILGKFKAFFRNIIK